jgi:cobaltochelatase CobT
VSDPVRSTIGKRDAHGIVRHGGEWLTIWADPGSVATPAERTARAVAGRAREQRAKALAATMRAIAGTRLRINAPPLPLHATVDEIAAARGAADTAGLRARHHDADLHARLAPAEARARALFDALEEARFRALGVRAMPGILGNLAAVLSRRLEALGLRHSHLAAQVPLVEALPMVALDAFLERDAPLVESGALEMWHRFAGTRFGSALASLRPHLADQASFAAAAHDAIRAMFAAMQWDDETNSISPGSRAGDAALLGLEPVGSEGDDPGGEEQAGHGESIFARGQPPAAYRRFSTAFDLVADAADLAGPEEQRALRDKLDTSMGDMRATLTRLANRLQRHLLADRLGAWNFDQEEGLLDTARLDRVVTAPGAALSFKQEIVAPARDTVVALLIDCSGSMRGRPIALAAMAADLAAQALERCGVAVEVLGFTTRGWKGGETARQWATAGRPRGPGRICDLLHVVYKAAGTPYRQARTALAVMLRENGLRENVDGEALLWAVGRLRSRPERRRLLVVVSDGAPSDRATLDANDPMYLDRHLREVVAAIEASGRIELSAIGIGHPADRIYRDAVVVETADALGSAMLSLLGRKLRR